MKDYTAVVERDEETGTYIGYVPGIPGAHSQADTLEDLAGNLREVLEMIFEDGIIEPDTSFIGTQIISIGANGRQTASPQAA